MVPICLCVGQEKGGKPHGLTAQEIKRVTGFLPDIRIKTGASIQNTLVADGEFRAGPRVKGDELPIVLTGLFFKLDGLPV